MDITTPSGQRIRESTGRSNRKAAQEYHDRLKAQAWREQKLGERHSASWDEAALRFLKEASGKASLKEYEKQIAFWTEHFQGQLLSAITRDRVAKLVEAKADTPVTRNRYIACLRAVLRNEDAVAVVRGQLGKHLKRVFADHDGQQMNYWTTTANNARKSACREADIKSIRCHDLRHTWASWHVQLGTPLYVLRELGGWATLEMVNRYAHLAPEHLKAHAERISIGSTARLRHSAEERKEAAVA